MTTRTNQIAEIDLLPLLEQDLGTGKRTGQNITWHCPFHQDDTPSFVFSPTKHIVTCFGACDHTWDAAGYVMQRDHCDYPTALRTLGVSTRLDETEALAQLRARGLTPATIQRFQITSNTRKQAWQYPVEGGNRYKAFDSQAERKYWHDKGVRNQWYGLDSVSRDLVYLCEGESDVWIMAQAGFQAISGIYGAGKLPNLQPLRDHGVKKLFIVYDNDAKGKTASAAAAAELRAAGFTVEVLDVGGAEGNDINRLYLANPAQFAAAVHALPEVKSLPPTSSHLDDLKLHQEIRHVITAGWQGSALQIALFGDRRGAQRAAAFQILAAGGSPQTLQKVLMNYPIGTGLDGDMPRLVQNALWRVGAIAADLRKQVAELHVQRDTGNDIGALTYRWLRDHGYFAHTVTNQLYYFNEDEKHLYDIDSYEFEAFLQAITELNATSSHFAYMQAYLRAKAHREGLNVVIAKFCYYDRDANVLRLSRFNGEVYRLDGDTIHNEGNGDGGVIFADAPGWQPWTYAAQNTGGISSLLHSFNWQQSAQARLKNEQQELLLQLWLLATCFPEIQPTKPILTLTGGLGAGKSFALRAVLRILYGTGGEVVAFPDNAEDFDTIIGNTYHQFFDNADSTDDWVNNSLARLATGEKIERRKLYTTNEKESMIPRGFAAITTRTVNFRREDVASRLLVLNLETRKKCLSEAALLRDVDKHRANYLRDLVDDLQVVIRALKQGRENKYYDHRLADFAAMMETMGMGLNIPETEIAALLTGLAGKQQDLVLEDEPLVACIEYWLQDKKNEGREVTAKELFDICAPLPPNTPEEMIPTGRGIATHAGVEWRYKNALSMGKRLVAIKSMLAEYFRIEQGMSTQEKNHNRVIWRFWRKM